MKIQDQNLRERVLDAIQRLPPERRYCSEIAREVRADQGIVNKKIQSLFFAGEIERCDAPPDGGNGPVRKYYRVKG